MELTDDVTNWENEGGFVPPEQEVMFDDRPSLQDATWLEGNAAGGGVLVNGELFAPGYAYEAAAYEQRTRQPEPARGGWVIINLEDEADREADRNRYAADLGLVLDTYYSEVVEDFGDAEAASRHANWLNDTCPRCGGDHDRITPSDCPLWQPTDEEVIS